MAGRKGEKFWADAVRRAVSRRVDGKKENPRLLEKLAEKLVDSGLEGDMQALKEIGDRLDGRPKQATEVSGPEGGAIPVSEVVYRIADPNRTD